MLLHTKLPLAMESNMDTPRESNDVISVIMCQALHSNQTYNIYQS